MSCIRYRGRSSPPPVTPPRSGPVSKAANADIVKGRDVGGGDYVIVEPEELDDIAPGRSRSIDITSFIDSDEIDPVYFQKAYWLAPHRNGPRARHRGPLEDDPRRAGGGRRPGVRDRSHGRTQDVLSRSFLILG
ncbi:MAG: hypothetical protein DLM62_07185, partial [Pseudonocardiales bacterium]